MVAGSRLLDRYTCTCSSWGGETICDESCAGDADLAAGGYGLDDGITLGTDEASFFLLHASAYNVPAHPPRGASRIPLPQGERLAHDLLTAADRLPRTCLPVTRAGTWRLRPIDFARRALLPATAVYVSPGVHTPALIDGAQIAISDLVRPDTTAPVRSRARRCTRRYAPRPRRDAPDGYYSSVRPRNPGVALMRSATTRTTRTPSAAPPPPRAPRTSPSSPATAPAIRCWPA